MLQTILALIGPLLAALLPRLGASSSVDTLITAALAAAQAIITGLKTGSSVNADLTVLEAALAALQSDTSLDPAVLGDVAEILRDLEAAITAYEAAELSTDPSTLTPLPSV